MKRYIFVCIFAVLILFGLSAEETVSEPSSEIMGAAFNVAIPLGEFSDYSGLGYGGGVVYEFGLPLHSETESYFLKNMVENLTVALRANFNLLSTDDPRLDRVLNFQILSSLLTKFPLGNSGLSIVPELGFGAALNLLTTSEFNVDDIESVYVDQIYLIGCGLRFSNPNFFHNKIALDVVPTFSLSPERDAVVLYQSLRVGVLFL